MDYLIEFFFTIIMGDLYDCLHDYHFRVTSPVQFANHPVIVSETGKYNRAMNTFKYIRQLLRRLPVAYIDSLITPAEFELLRLHPHMPHHH